MEKALTKNQILTELTRSSHSALDEYYGVGFQASKEDPEFMAHLIAWDAVKGQVRDSKIALPIVSLACPFFREPEFIDNSLAHLARLTPRELYTAYMFSKGFVKNKEVLMVPNPKTGKLMKSRVGGWKRYTTVGPIGAVRRMNELDRLVARYLRYRESDEAMFQKNILNFRSDIIRLYSLTHTSMSSYAKSIIMDKVYPSGSALEAVRNLERMSPKEAAAAIIQHKLPFLSLFPILKKKVKDPMLLMAIIDRMSPTELQSNIQLLERLGVNDFPESRAALQQGLVRMSTSRKTTLKTSKAAEGVKDQTLKTALDAVQEKQISNLKGLDGNWLILADMSGSMSSAIDIAVRISGTLARMVKGEIALVFFSTSPRYYDVTGKTLEEIRQMTRHIVAMGGTSIGCGLLAAASHKFDAQGIIVVSDGEENTPPFFVDQYKPFLQALNRDVPVYYFKVAGGSHDTFYSGMMSCGHSVELRDLRGQQVDDYSIPNMVQSLRTNRYSVLDEIMETRLLTVDKVLGVQKEEMEYATK